MPWLTSGVYFLSYGSLRFPLEMLRDPSQGGVPGGISSAQIMCLSYITLGAAILIGPVRSTLRRGTARTGTGHGSAWRVA